MDAVGSPPVRWSGEGAVRRFMDPEVDVRPGLLPPGEGTRYLGHDGVMDWVRNVNDGWVTVTVVPMDRRELADDRILSIDVWHFEGRDGIEVTEELPTAFTFRDGLIVRIDGFTDKAEAFEALGVDE